MLDSILQLVSEVCKVIEFFNKTLYVFGLLGIPSIFTVMVFVLRKVQADAKQLKIMMAAQQAQMRSQLLKDYYHYVNRGFIYESELADWENQYQAYHSLGANGIMDNRRQRLLNLDVKEEIV